MTVESLTQNLQSKMEAAQIESGNNSKLEAFREKVAVFMSAVKPNQEQNTKAKITRIRMRQGEKTPHSSNNHPWISNQNINTYSKLLQQGHSMVPTDLFSATAVGVGTLKYTMSKTFKLCKQQRADSNLPLNIKWEEIKISRR